MLSVRIDSHYPIRNFIERFYFPLLSCQTRAAGEECRFQTLVSLAPLKLARPFLRPPLYHHLLFGVELDCVTPLPMQDAKKTVAPSAEREIGHGRCHPDVDSDISRGYIVTKL